MHVYERIKYCIHVTENFRWTKHFAKPRYLYIAENNNIQWNK